jgi:hypothetical protein
VCVCVCVCVCVLLVIEPRALCMLSKPYTSEPLACCELLLCIYGLCAKYVLVIVLIFVTIYVEFCDAKLL